MPQSQHPSPDDEKCLSTSPGNICRRWKKFKGRVCVHLGAIDQRLGKRVAERLPSEYTQRQNSNMITGSIDNEYFGGELDGDPFGRDPIVNIFMCKASSTLSLSPRCRRSYVANKPDVPLFPQENTSNSFLSSVGVLHNDIDADILCVSDGGYTDGHSGKTPRCISPLSEASFYTCQSGAFDEGPQGDDSSSSCSEVVNFSSSLTVFHEISALNRHLTFLPRARTPIRMSPLRSDHKTSASAFAHEIVFTADARESICPLSLKAADVAFDRRNAQSLRRTASSPHLSPQDRSSSTITESTSPAIGDSRPPSYTSCFSVPSYGSTQNIPGAYPI